MKNFSALFLILSLLSLQSGCATIVGGGGSQKVELQSEPSGAEVFVDGVNQGKTPVSLTLERRDTHQLKFKKAGYAEEILMTKKKMNGWIWGNLVLGGIIGILIDMSSGASNKIDPSNYYVVMTKKKPTVKQIAPVQIESKPAVETDILTKPSAPALAEPAPAATTAAAVPAEPVSQASEPAPQTSGSYADIVKLSAQEATPSQTQPVSDTVVQAGAKADLSSTTTAATSSSTTLSQDSASTDLNAASQTAAAPVSTRQ